MKKFLIRSGMAGAILALQCALVGCPWVDEEAPDRTIVDPEAYEPVHVAPEAVAGIEGYQLPTTAAIRDFLGEADFRIAITHLGEEGFGIYLLEPGESDQPPRILRYSNGRETFNGSKAAWNGNCDLSPEGDRLAYSLGSEGGYSGMLSIVWLLNLGSASDLRVPLFSHQNRSYGMIGERPYWHEAGGRSFIGFRGGRLVGNADEAQIPLSGGMESQMVEVITDSVLSSVFPVQAGGARVVGDVLGISRDGELLMIRVSSGHNLLLPAARVPDLRDNDSLPDFLAGNGASLNPFDSGSSRHSDFYATPRFSVSETTGNKEDTVADPRTLDGRRMTASHPLAGDNFWICDAERRIHFSQKVGTQSLNQVVWTTHPNFVLALDSFRSVHLVRLAGSKDEVLDGGEDATRRADGVLSLFVRDYTAGNLLDISMWIP